MESKKAEPFLKEVETGEAETVATVDLSWELWENPVLHRSMQLAKIENWLVPFFLLLLDYAAIVVALWSTYYLRSDFLPHFFSNLPLFSLSSHYIYYYIPFIYLVFIIYEKLYTRRLPFSQNVGKIFKACVYATAIIVGFMYFTKVSWDISRIYVATSGLITFIYLTAISFIMRRIMILFGIWQKPVLVVGTAKSSRELALKLAQEPEWGYKVIGLVEQEPYYEEPRHKSAQQFISLGDFQSMELVIDHSGVQDLMIAAGDLERDELLDLVYRVQPFVNRLTIVPGLTTAGPINLDAEFFQGQKTITLDFQNSLAKTVNKVLKRSLDVVLSLLGLTVGLPIFILVAVVIFINSPGPVIFAHKRIGYKGKLFPCLKFRTMVPDAECKLEAYLNENAAAREEWHRDFKLRDDPRITKAGNFLRKTSLDELPQLANILLGQMSLVGPRPIVSDEVSKYGEFIRDYYMVRPGLTGYWQVNGRNDVEYETRVMMDSWYARNWTFWLDAGIVLKTVKAVFETKGAY